MALYRGSTKLAGVGKGFSPENVGTEGQVLTKTNTGYEWQDGGNTPEPVIEEKIVYKMNADASGNLYISTAGYSGGAYNSYDWKVSVDNGAATTYTGTGSSGSMITLSGYTANSNHTIKIEPTTEAYGWARAFGNFTYVYGPLVTEIVYDKTYKGFATSATDTGNYFRYRVYRYFNIKTAPEEYLPDTVTTIGRSFREQQCSSCSSLEVTPDEYIPSSITSIGDWFRANQYSDCISLQAASEECLPNNITSIPNNFRSSQYSNCWNITETPIEVIGDRVTSIGNNFRSGQFMKCYSLVKANPEYLPNNITTIGDGFRSGQYSYSPSLTSSSKECLPSSVTTIGTAFRSSQYGFCENLTHITGWVDRSITVGNMYRNSQFFKRKSTSINILVIGSPGNVNADSNVFTNSPVSTVYAENTTKQTELQNSTYSPRSSISDSNILTLY